MFVLGAVIQTAVVGVAESLGKMNATPAAPVTTNQIQTNNGEDQQTVFETVVLVLAEVAVLAGKSPMHAIFAHFFRFRLFKGQT